MPKKLTWNWLEPRLVALNAKWLEESAGLYRGKLNDVKRGKTTLTAEEFEAVCLWIDTLADRENFFLANAHDDSSAVVD